MMTSLNTTTTGDANGITDRNTNDITVKDNNINVNDNSGPFVVNIIPQTKQLLTNINPTDPTLVDLVPMYTILHTAYQVDEK